MNKFCKLILSVLLILSFLAGGCAFAASPLIEEGDALLQTEPPEYEKAAEQNFELAAENGYEPGQDETAEWRTVTQEEAKRIMKRTGCTVLDVRTREEYDSGHIPGAVCVPVETIAEFPPEDLPDLNQTILVYCRSGNRSKQAAGKLAAMGYTGVLEFGGIKTWDGETVATGEGKALRDFEDMDKVFSGEMPIHMEYEILGDLRVNAEEESWISLIRRRLADVQLGLESDLEVADSGYWLTFTWKDGNTETLAFNTTDLFSCAGKNYCVIDDGGLFSALSALCETHETLPGRGGS